MMCGSSYRTTSWGPAHGWERGHHGSPFMLIAGIVVMAAIFKSGLWLPLLGLGLLVFAFARMNGGWQRGWDGEKPKRSFGPMDGRPWHGHVEPEAEKPKREQYDEYV